MFFKKCKHTWVKVSEQTLPSACEQESKIGKILDSNCPLWAYRKTYILILKCVKCGKLDKTTIASKE